MDMLLTLDPPEILALGTPKLSHGTKIFWSKFFLPYNNYIIFYAFCWLVVQKMTKTANNRSFTSNLLLQPKSARITWFFQFLHFFCKTNPQNAWNIILLFWCMQNFDWKFLVPWDTFGVPRARISGRSGVRSMSIANSDHLGSIWISGTIGTSGASQKT